MRLLLSVVFAFLLIQGALHAQFESIWHSPADASEIPGGVTMRDPLFPGTGTTATFYQGVWRGDGANQTGGTFHYRIDGGTWQNVSLGFHANDGDLQFWKSDLLMPAAGSVVEYYFFVTLSNRDDTWLFSGNSKSLDEGDAQANPYSFTVGTTSSSGGAELLVNSINADYGALNFYIDEIRDTEFPQLEISFTPGAPGLTEVEIFTNLNNRDRANLDWDGDGIEDGIIPPDGNLITTADTDAYYQAYAMTDAGGGTYTLTLPVEKTGAYRLTARFRTSDTPDWQWIRDQGIRDLAIVVAPNTARDMNVYELHVTNANATGPTFAQRGTFEDLHDPAARVNLNWLVDLGLNWIWFQPFHPQGIDGRETDPATGQAYDPGSPYSIRNFWEINPLYTREWNDSLPNAIENPDNYAAAMQAFADFAAASDAAGIQLMLDFPFNHTSPDVVLGAVGVELFAPEGNPGNWQPNDQIRDRVPPFFSTDGSEGPPAYSAPAQSAVALAVAPDRNDFGKWNDVRDVFFGTYSTLVTGFPDAETSRQITQNEDDLMFYGSMGPQTINVWRYFGEVLPYWLEQSGHRGFNSTPADGDAETREALDLLGIDGLRKDFGQGLPPQAMEYIINRTHSVKWNFVFMSESLDGGPVTYRSSRHFAVLNENIVFPLQAATTAPAYRGIFEERRNAYGQSLVLLNNTSHDEVPYADPWQALIRYATVSTNDGAPMIMYGQEIGAGQRMQESLPQGSWDWYELNFGKYIPHFKKWNSLQPQWSAWDNNDLGTQFLFPVYSGISQARLASPALRSSNRWFLNRHFDGNPNNEIFAVAKYETPNVSAAFQDVVLGFTNLDRDNPRSDTFGVPSNLADLLGLADGRTYNVRNLAAYLGRNNEHPGRRDEWLWGTSGRTRAEITGDGVFVSMNPVPDNDATWETAPYEAQFLRIYDVTPPPSPAPEAPFFVLGDTATFTWQPNGGPHDNITTYLVEIRDQDNNLATSGEVADGSNQFTFTGNTGNTYYATITAVSAAGIESTTPGTSDTGAPNPESSTTPVVLLDPDEDTDGNGMTNAQETIAGTNPLDPLSIFRVTNTAFAPSEISITVASVPGRMYQIETSTTLEPGSWQPLGDPVTAIADSLSLNTAAPENDDPHRFYRVSVMAP